MVRRLGVLVAVAVLLAGCGGDRYVQSGGDGATAVAGWAGFRATATPGPVVLVGRAVIGAPYGELILPGRLPDGPRVDAAGRPLQSARNAAFTLGLASRALPTRAATTPGAPGPPPSPRPRLGALRVTAIRLGVGTFQTYRGPQRLPAWLFTVAGSPTPVAVLAITPYTPTAPGDPAGQVQLSSDGRGVMLDLLGYPPDGRTCLGGEPSPRVYETPNVVALLVDYVGGRRPPQGSAVDCVVPTVHRTVTFTLSAPLGPRVLVDSSGRMYTIQPYQR